MTNPERLLAGEATDFERQLLAAWGRRQPSAEARAKVLAVAGVGFGAAALTTASATAAKATATSVAPKAVLGWSAVLVKWLAIGVVGATATAGAVAYVHHLTQPATVTSDAPAPSPATVREPAIVATTPQTPADEPPAIELGPTTPAARAKSPPARPSTLDEEIALVDQAKRALSGGDTAGALRLLAAYDAKYPAGELAQESTETRIETLLAEGNRAAANRLATKFVAAHPSSPYVHRIRGLLSDGK